MNIESALGYAIIGTSIAIMLLAISSAWMQIQHKRLSRQLALFEKESELVKQLTVLGEQNTKEMKEYQSQLHVFVKKPLADYDANEIQNLRSIIHDMVGKFEKFPEAVIILSDEINKIRGHLPKNEEINAMTNAFKESVSQNIASWLQLKKTVQELEKDINEVQKVISS